MACFQILGMDLKGADQQFLIFNKVSRTVKIGQHPFMGVKNKRVDHFGAAQHSALFIKQCGSAAKSGIDMKPEIVAMTDFANRHQGIDRC